MPANFGIFLGFGVPIPGREQGAIRVFGETMQYLMGQAQQGNIESVEPILLQPHGGDLGGFFLIRGDQARLSQMVASDEFQRLLTRATAIVSNLGAVPCFMGEEVQRRVGTFEQDTADLR